MGERLTSELSAPRVITQGSGGPISKEAAEKERVVALDLRPHVHQPTYINVEALRGHQDEQSTLFRESEKSNGQPERDREVSSERGMGTSDSPQETCTESSPVDVPEIVPQAKCRKSRPYSDWMNPAVKDGRKIDPVAVRNMVAGLDTRTKLYTLREAAVVLRHAPITMRAWIKAGKLKARKMGGQWFVSGYELSRQIGEVGHGKRRMAR